MKAGQVTEPLTVRQLAARAAVRTDTIRYYEREGLLPAPRRTDGDHRRYGPADLDRLLFIRGAQRLGLRLAEIRELLAVRDTGTCACEPAEALLRRHVAEIGTEIDAAGARCGPSCSPCWPPCPARTAPTRCPGPGALRPLPTRKEVTAMCPCCGTSTCDGSCWTTYANAAELTQHPRPQAPGRGPAPGQPQSPKWPQAPAAHP